MITDGKWDLMEKTVTHGLDGCTAETTTWKSILKSHAESIEKQYFRCVECGFVSLAKDVYTWSNILMCKKCYNKNIRRK
jgi:formylmethanofuran dehydrogenase subunit E